MRGATRGRLGCGLVLAAVGLGAPFVYLGDATLTGRPAPYSGPQTRAIGQPEPPPSRWPRIETMPLALLGLLLAAAGCVTGFATIPSQTGLWKTALDGGLVGVVARFARAPAADPLGKLAAAAGLAVGLVIAAALGLAFASGFVPWPVPAP